MRHARPVCSLVGVLSPLSDSREPVAAKLLKLQVICTLNFSGSKQKKPHYLDDLTFVVAEDKCRSIAGLCVRWWDGHWGRSGACCSTYGRFLEWQYQEGQVGKLSDCTLTSWVLWSCHILGFTPFPAAIPTLHCIPTLGPWSLLDSDRSKASPQLSGA